MIPKGTLVSGQITSIMPYRKKGDAIKFRIDSMTLAGRTYSVASEVTRVELDKVRTGRNSAGKVAAAAGVGAVLGQVLGRDARSTIIGAAGGVMAGAVVANRTGRVDQCVPEGGHITATLTEPLKVTLSE
ncbi:MAG TPA: hypothetical protein VHM24_04690 [Gemmatimonadaceae bacterium]|nr:hypothetical protein [Gemmatimonadaceae bacterium]